MRFYPNKFFRFLTICLLLSGCQQTSKHNVDTDDLTQSMDRGKAVYDTYCISCHMKEGKGVDPIFPPLAASDYLMDDISRAIHVVKYGQTGNIVVNGKTYDATMTSLGLDDEQIADVLNYVTHSWGNTNDRLITPKEVSKVAR